MRCSIRSLTMNPNTISATTALAISSTLALPGATYAYAPTLSERARPALSSIAQMHELWRRSIGDDGGAASSLTGSPLCIPEQRGAAPGAYTSNMQPEVLR
jgi:hypothetical protein